MNDDTCGNCAGSGEISGEVTVDGVAEECDQCCGTGIDSNGGS